jgi:hypothetical protein
VVAGVAAGVTACDGDGVGIVGSFFFLPRRRNLLIALAIVVLAAMGRRRGGWIKVSQDGISIKFGRGPCVCTQLKMRQENRACMTE